MGLDIVEVWKRGQMERVSSIVAEDDGQRPVFFLVGDFYFYVHLYHVGYL